ncbi:hypothetical protein SASPL_150650 [Salvia splendens]|uniref:Uncharacterized protein n=1 Tax=Salvia splendens TaxID=180675 RepID=A0A8X8W7U6_SALSN|nr:uncharacterized protein LOC121781243 [Salvia splendens]KAG6389191.1 hypothetical protein SASPL_150650 [Salvia splendens]
MGAEKYRKSGQIPAFGDWENANELPITQYFDCARQAGLLRCSCSAECSRGGAKAPPLYTVPHREERGGVNKQSNEQMKKVKAGELMIEPRIQHVAHSKQSSTNLVRQKSSVSAKPVDEDLYKIPPELLANSKRKKMLGFFSKCMVPPCAE